METPVVDWLLASSPDIRSGCFCDFPDGSFDAALNIVRGLLQYLY
jgi:hypothetical protein